jgi:hypothetical protein
MFVFGSAAWECGAVAAGVNQGRGRGWSWDARPACCSPPLSARGDPEIEGPLRESYLLLLLSCAIGQDILRHKSMDAAGVPKSTKAATSFLHILFLSKKNPADM